MGGACYRAPIAQRTLAPILDYGQLGYAALGAHTGAIVVLDPQYGRVLKRVARGMDVQFTTSPFEVVQVVTIYAALDSGVINAQTKLPCSNTDELADISEALARPCPAFFAELSKRVPPAAFKRAAQIIGFTYYGTESVNAMTTAMRPITAAIPTNLSGADYEALTTRGTGMKANELHFAQLAISLASNTTTSERMSTIIATTSQTISPPPIPVNKAALEVIRKGLVRSVAEGTAMAAGTVKTAIAGKAGSDEENALFVSFAPADKPEIGLVVFLKEGTSTQAAQVAGRFYRAYFGK
ncbi:MAG TPA: penicillin-binding transpeptidase domain-containing protein [Blastocatellia bacterium]|nr:penicillin-binding transpeptidase domain-containing protein [Blastocatellia bacterium]